MQVECLIQRLCGQYGFLRQGDTPYYTAVCGHPTQTANDNKMLNPNLDPQELAEQFLLNGQTVCFVSADELTDPAWLGVNSLALLFADRAHRRALCAVHAFELELRFVYCKTWLYNQQIEFSSGLAKLARTSSAVRDRR